MAVIRVLKEEDFTVNTSATQIPVPLENGVTSLVVTSDNSNTETCYLGSSDVSNTGANRGYPLEPEDKVIVPVVGPGADNIFLISTSVAQTFRLQQWGR